MKLLYEFHQLARVSDVMNAWIECPQCRGVLKLSTSHLEGPCVFCQTPLRVALTVQPLAAVPAQAFVTTPIPGPAPAEVFASAASGPEPRHKLGRGPMPKFRPLQSRPT